jgi:hypothetical protein
MCNLYSYTKGQAAIRELGEVLHDRTGNLPPPSPAPASFRTILLRSSAIGPMAASLFSRGGACRHRTTS